MAEIILKNGETCFIDDADLPLIRVWNWRAQYDGRRARCVQSVVATKNRNTVLMHRLILGVDSDTEVDHRDRNPLNNRRSNLRRASHAENSYNRGRFRNNRSGLKGVYFDPRREAAPYRAQIRVRGHKICIGSFATAEAAARAYVTAAVKYHGEFAAI